MIVLRRTLSRTLTTPLVTRVSVPAHESWTSHFVPRTVAALYWPRVRNAPLPSPHSRRVLGFLAAADALPRLGQAASFSVSVRSVVALVWPSLKMPSKKLAICSLPPFCCTDVSWTVPFLVSTVAPTGMPCVPSSSTNRFVPGRRTFTVPLTVLATTVLPATGVGVGVGVGVALGVVVGGGGPGMPKPVTGGAVAPCSYAPASQAPPALRGANRWSTLSKHWVSTPLASLFAGIVRTSVWPPWSDSAVASPMLFCSACAPPMQLSKSSTFPVSCCASGALQFVGEMLSPMLPANSDPRALQPAGPVMPPGFVLRPLLPATVAW